MSLRNRPGLWFGLGLVAAAALMRLGPSAATVPDLLVASPCAVELTVSDGEGEPEQVTLRGPGTYRLGTTMTAGLVLVHDGMARAARELPITADGALALPAEWCAGATAAPGLGLG